jgi:hypothetical protein
VDYKILAIIGGTIKIYQFGRNSDWNEVSEIKSKTGINFTVAR